MTKETLVFILGIVLALVPFLGVPEIWKQYTVIGVGVLLILVGYMLRRSLYFSRIDRGNGERGDDSFVETTKPLFEDKTVQ
jgi:uncharacterized membrane protein